MVSLWDSALDFLSEWMLVYKMASLLVHSWVLELDHLSHSLTEGTSYDAQSAKSGKQVLEKLNEILIVLT